VSIKDLSLGIQLLKVPAIKMVSEVGVAAGSDSIIIVTWALQSHAGNTITQISIAFRSIRFQSLFILRWFASVLAKTTQNLNAKFQTLETSIPTFTFLTAARW
jgi:hypothetical protein